MRNSLFALLEVFYYIGFLICLYVAVNIDIDIHVIWQNLLFCFSACNGDCYICNAVRVKNFPFTHYLNLICIELFNRYIVLKQKQPKILVLSD